MDLDILSIGLVIAAAFGTAVFHSVGGFAGGLLLAICLAPILGVKEAVPVTATAMIVSNSARTWAFRKAVNWRIFQCVFIAALPGIVAGAVVYITLPVHVVALVLGLFLIVSVPLRRAMAAKQFHIRYRGLAAAGLPYGLVSGTTFGAGMMLAPFLLGAGLMGENLVATVAALGFGLNLTKSVVFGLSPLLDMNLAAKGAMIGLFTIPGAFVGRWIIRSTPIRIHTVFMEIFVLTGAGYFLWHAAAGFGLR